MSHRIKSIALTGLMVSFNCQALDPLSISKKDGLMVVKDQSLPIVASKYIGFAAHWQWAGAKVKALRAPSGNTAANTRFEGQADRLGIDFKGDVSQKGGQLIWQYDWNKKDDIEDAMGFGIQFQLNLNSPTFNGKSPTPELLPDNQGWHWQMPNGQTLTVKFVPAAAKVYFEKGHKNEIRAMFFTNISKGREQTTMTVSVDGAGNNQAAPELPAPKADYSRWHQEALSENASPIDLSYLNDNDKPAGSHGILHAEHDKLVFADGTPTKFWGTNLVAYTLFTISDSEIEEHAKRLAQLGFNLVRLHHHDSKWVKPNIFEHPDDNTQTLSEASLKKLDWWIHCLKKEGIYVWLDLNVGRVFTDGDGIDHYEELASGKGKKDGLAKGFNYLNPSLQKQMRAFNDAYLGHVNPYTKTAYKDEPAIIAILLTNENDLTQHFGNMFLPDKPNTPVHNQWFADAAKTFSDAHKLAYKKTMRSWEMGESKLFLNDLEHRFNQTEITEIRQLGYKGLIATTNSWGKMGIFSLASLNDGDIIDTHSYGFEQELKHNPHFNPTFLDWIAAAQVTDKPLTTTEWAIEPTSQEDRFTSPLYTASIANLQGWDAMMLFSYNHGRFGKKSKPGGYSFFKDPSVIGLMPAGALIFRQNQVAPAQKHYRLQLSEQDFFFKRVDPSTSAAIRTLSETSQLTISLPETPELPWLKPTPAANDGSIVVSNPDQDFLPEQQSFVVSDTGELKRDWTKGIHTINTSLAQVASGWIGGETIKLDNAQFAIGTSTATIAVQSLDQKPIDRSERIFITAVAKAEIDPDNKLSYLSEPITGNISFHAPAGLKLHPISKQGLPETAVGTVFQQGRYTIDLGKSPNHWYILSK